MQKAAQDQQTGKMVVFDAIVAVTDDGIKKWLDPKLRQAYCLQQPCSNDQEANNRKIVELAQSLQADNPNLSAPQAVQLAINKITTADVGSIGSTLLEGDPNRLIALTDPNSGKELTVRNILTIPVTIADLQQLSNDAKQNSTVFSTGVWNDPPRGAQLGIQQTPVLDPVTQKEQIVATGNTAVGSTYLVHVDKANNVLGEAVVAGIDKAAEVLGLITPAAKLKADSIQALSSRTNAQGQVVATDIALNSVGQSRGTSTDVGAYRELASRGFRNDNLNVIENNPAATQSRITSSASAITKPGNISIYAPPNDPVVCFVGGYACNPTAAFQTLYSVMMTSYSVHSSGNTGAVGSNSADVNKPFSYSGLDIGALNQARASQTQTFLQKYFNQPPSVTTYTPFSYDLTLQRQQQQDAVNVQMQTNLSIGQQPIQLPVQESKSQDSRIDSLKDLQQNLSRGANP